MLGPDVATLYALPTATRLFRNGLALHLDASTLSGSTGAAVTSWRSRVGTYSFTGGVAPSLRPAGTSAFPDGRAAVRFGGTHYLRDDTAAALFASGAPMTVALVGTRTTNTDNCALGLGVGSTLWQAYLDHFTAGNNGTPKIYDGGANPSGSSPVTRTTEPFVIFWIRNPGGTSTVIANGQRTTFSLGSDAHVYVNACVGAILNSGTPANFWHGDMASLCAWQGVLGDIAIAAATIRLNAVLLKRRQLCLRGDSITRGSASSSYSWATVLSADGSTAWSTGEALSLNAVRQSGGRVYEVTTAGTTGTDAPTGTGAYTDNGGVSWLYVCDILPSTCLDTLGTPSQGIMGAVAERTAISRAGANDPTNSEYDHRADVTGIYDADVPRAIIEFLSRNDMKFGATARQAADGYWQLLDALRTANPRDFVVAVTPLVSGDIDTSGLAAIIAAEYGAHADYLLPARDCPQLQDINSQPWWVEGVPPVIHPSAKGQTALARFLQPFIAAIQAACLNKHIQMMLHGLP